MRARHVAAFVLRQMNFSYPDIGAALSKDHTGMISAVRGISDLLASGNLGLMEDVKAVQRRIDSSVSEMDEVHMRISALEVRLRDAEALEERVKTLEGLVHQLMAERGR